MDLEKELKEVQIQYDKVCHERNELKKENRLLKKELEVLEILKKHSTRLDDEDWNSNIFNGIDYENLNEEERKVIKEWLENDN